MQTEKKWIAEGKNIIEICLPNRNNKKENDVMVQLNLAPQKRVNGPILENTIFKIRWQNDDHSDQVIFYQMLDLVRIKVSDLNDYVCYTAHGTCTAECVEWLIKKYNVGLETELACYIYKKLN